MRKIAFIFPGQGSQHVGMAKEIYDNYSEAQAVFKEADQVLGRSISKLCFEGPEDQLKDTRNAQPAIVTTSIALMRVLQGEGIKPDYCAGHSLGEYSALITSAAISFPVGLELVQTRSRLMADADPAQQGAMAAILGIDRNTLAGLLQEASAVGKVEAANYNCPGQIVASGAKNGITKLQELVSTNGGKVIPLAVSGAFHSSFMQKAADAFRPELEKVQWNEPAPPVIANVSALPAGRTLLADSLYRQIFSSVLWEDSLNHLWNHGVRMFVEVGPGKVLSGLVKKTLKDATFVNCEDLSSIKKALAILREV
ncbi:MAG TPA: [acyl-carrier-protein] S-malonyltransferase [Firmicutes bacterium]|nr:[acyl-carrier-protein] S-malonyltransferase [Bacillota bacterium]